MHDCKNLHSASMNSLLECFHKDDNFPILYKCDEEESNAAQNFDGDDEDSGLEIKYGGDGTTKLCT